MGAVITDFRRREGFKTDTGALKKEEAARAAQRAFYICMLGPAQCLKDVKVTTNIHLKRKL